MKYINDPLGAICLELAQQSKAKVGFGAVLINRSGDIIGRGRNRLSKPGEYQLLGGGIDYATHAEQAAIINAIEGGCMVERGTIFVLGMVLQGKNKGDISVRPSEDDKYFTCIKCARTCERFNLHINIPLPSEWYELSAEEALKTAQNFQNSGKKIVFTKPS